MAEWPEGVSSSGALRTVRESLPSHHSQLGAAAGGLRGWQPKKHRELPGNEALWQAYRQLQTMVRYRQALRKPP